MLYQTEYHTVPVLQVLNSDLYVRSKSLKEQEERLGEKHLTTEAYITQFHHRNSTSQVDFQHHATTMEAIAKYDFKATADDELSFKRGEVLKVSHCCFISRSLDFCVSHGGGYC